jgi:hypothetical protein
MKLKNTITSEIIEVKIILSTDSSASSYGQPVCLVGGEAVDGFTLAFLEIIEATAEEKDMFARVSACV